MSKGEKDTGKLPTRRTAEPTKVSSRIKQVGPVNYAELDLSTSDTESESTVVGSESGFGSIKLEGEMEQIDIEGDELTHTWTSTTIRNTATQVGIKVNRLADENLQLRMARETEWSYIDKLMEMMLTMHMEDQKREDQKRESEREEWRERERIEQRERDEKREEA